MTSEEAKRRKLEILDFVEYREVVTPYELMEEFGYTYSYACKKLSLLKGQGLVETLERGRWVLTNAGYKRFHYLSQKFGGLTRRQKEEWRVWQQKESEKPPGGRKIWLVTDDGLSIRLVKQGEYGVTLEEARDVVRANRQLGGWITG